MDLLPELIDLMIQFLSINDLIHFRLVGKDLCARAKEYEGLESEMVYPNTLTGLFQSFPRIKYLNASKCEVNVSDFHTFGKIKDLKISIKPLETADIFLSCPNLTDLQLIDHFLHPNIDINLVFQGLTRLKCLHLINLEEITDHALLYLPLLEDLCLWDRCGISGTGIQSLKRLKKLTIEKYLEIVSRSCKDIFNEKTSVDLGYLIERVFHRSHHVHIRILCVAS